MFGDKRNLSIPWDAISSVASVVLAIGLPATLLYDWNSRKQELKQERYSQYAARYQEIFSHLPYNIFIEGSNPDLKDEKAKTWLVTYIDLCNEELFDFKEGDIEKRIWDDWKLFIIGAFNRSVPLREIFCKVREDYSIFDAFLKENKVAI